MKRESSARKSVRLSAVHPNAAGIDLGSREHYVALPPERASDCVRSFGCFTEDLQAMAEWLKQNAIETVAMESTGVYWVPVYQVLERAGIEVHLVNAKQLKTVPGRKTDVADCQWLQHLHECGLLRGSFRPEDAICVIRSYVRHRDTLIEESSRRILRMQKALEQMNIQLHKVVSDITGETGLAIIRAILNGERDPAKLAALRNYRCSRSVDEIAKAMVGDWRAEHLFCLQQNFDSYEFTQKQIESCERAALAALSALVTKGDLVNLPPAKDPRANPELRKALYLATGVDVTKIEGMAPDNVLAVISEIGTDVTKWHSEKAFTNWATVCPKNKITGGKRYKVPKQGAAGRVSRILRVAAQTLANSKTALGALYRRKRSQKGSSFAICVVAHQLARRIYRLLKYGDAYVAQAADCYEARYKDRLTGSAVRQLQRLGYTVSLTSVPVLEAVR
jgi:transposase